MAGSYYRGLTPAKNPLFSKQLGQVGQANPPTISRGNEIRGGNGQTYNYNAKFVSQGVPGVDGRIAGQQAGPQNMLGPGAYRAMGQTRQMGGYQPTQGQVDYANQQLAQKLTGLQLNKNLQPGQSSQSGQLELMGKLGQYSSAKRGYDPGPYEQYLNSQQQQPSSSMNDGDGGSYSSSQDPLAFNMDTWRQVRQEEDERAQRSRRQDNNTAAWAFFATQLANAFNPVPYDTTATARLSSQWR